MEEQKKTQEKVSEEIEQVETIPVKKIPKINKKLAAIIVASALVVIIIITAIVGGGKGSVNNDSGGGEGKPSDSNGNNSSYNSGSNLDDENGSNEGSSDVGTSNDGESNGNSSFETVSFYQFVTGYSEGLAFVTKDKYGSNPTCIDKNGNEVFSFEGGRVLSGFHNGWAMLSKWNSEENKDIVFLCDKNGNVKTAEDLGGDALVYRAGAFEDGYIFVEKTTTNYQGSIDEMAVFNSKMEKIVDFSSEFYICYYNVGNAYYNGYLLGKYDSYDIYLNLKNGVLGIADFEFYDSLTVEHESDMWRVDSSWDYFLYDRRDETRTRIIDLTDTNARIRSSNYKFVYYNNYGAYYSVGYNDGYAGVVFKVEDSQVGKRNYFTIMDENGDYSFEPIETNGIVEQIKNENGVFVLYNVNEFRNKASVEVYDQRGRIASIEFEIDDYHNFDMYFSESIICLRYAPWSASNVNETWIGVYNTKLEPIFEVEPIINN